MKKDDDQFGFQKSLDGNDEHWVEGRVYKGEKPWLSKYQGKNFERSTIWQRLKNKFVSSQKR